MKRILTSILGLALMSSAASADLVCQTTSVKQWSNYYGNWIVQQGPEQCYEQGPAYAPPPQYAPAPVYADPYPAPGVGELLVGGLIGAGIGYAIGHNNNGHKNNYYYYNGHNNYKHGNGGKHYKYPGGWNNGQGRPGKKIPQQPIGDGD